MKVGVIGTGKRFETIYLDILSALGSEIFAWNRSKDRLLSLSSKGVKSVSLNDLKNLDLDICLCFLPPDKSFDLVSPLELSCTILLETPVIDERWAKHENAGVLEQWIYLPVEQLKKKIYDQNIVSRPYWVFNDGRSFDYHAIAQLRSYCDLAKPKSYFGKMQQSENKLGFVDKTGKMNFSEDLWLHGNVELDNGSVLMHSFTYSCKMTNLKPIQLIRAYSSDGAIISGRINEMDNDYEMFEIRYLDGSRNVHSEKFQRELIEGTNTTKRIKSKNLSIEWNNPYCDLGFNDQQTAIATLLEEAALGKVYPALESFVDNLIISGMKHSAIHQTLVKG